MINFDFRFPFRHFLLAVPERLQPVQHEVQPVRTTNSAWAAWTAWTASTASTAWTTSTATTAASTAATVPTVPDLDAAFHPVRTADGRTSRRIPQRELPESEAGEFSGGDAEPAVWTDVTAAAVPVIRAATATAAATTTATASTETAAAFQPIPGEPGIHRTHFDKLSNVRFSVDVAVATTAGDDGAVHQLDHRATDLVPPRPPLGS